MVQVVHDLEVHELLSSARRFVDEFERASTTEENQIIGTRLSGSHAKGLSNRRSDVDILVYIKPSLRNLLGVRSFQFTTHLARDSPLRLADRQATCYEFEQRDWEPIILPVRSRNERDLWSAIARQNIDLIYKYLHSYPIRQIPFFDDLDHFLRDEVVLDPQRVFSYFDGHATSRLRKHLRRDGSAKKEQEKLSPHSVAKEIVEGVHLISSGLLLLERGEISRDFSQLYQIYGPELGEADIISTCVGLKKDNIDRVEIDLEDFLSLAATARARIHEKGHDLLGQALETAESRLGYRTLPDDLRLEQEVRIEQLFLGLYGYK